MSLSEHFQSSRYSSLSRRSFVIGFSLSVVSGLVALSVIAGLGRSGSDGGDAVPPLLVQPALAAKFEELRRSGNSSCSSAFQRSIPALPAGERLRGSCCSQMSLHRYREQVEGLKKYQDIPEIPPDPYDLDVTLAQKLMAAYDLELTAEEQQAYDYAMVNSDERGPCCCKCWRWYVYGGLAKVLIRDYDFTGEQVTDVWNLSDGCGGDEDHLH